MKIKITRADGTVIEAEGTPEECARLMPYPAIQYIPIPQYIPTLRMEPPYLPWGTWCGTTITKIGDEQVSYTSNGTAFTAGGAAELGRKIQSDLRAAEARYGSGS